MRKNHNKFQVDFSSYLQLQSNSNFKILEIYEAYDFKKIRVPLQTRKKMKYVSSPVTDQFIQDCRWPVALLLLSSFLALG